MVPVARYYPIHMNCTLYFFSINEDKIYDKSKVFDLLQVKNSAYSMLQKYE